MAMDIVAVTAETIELVVSDHEFVAISRCLNEVCNGFQIPDFQGKIGAQLGEVKALLRKMGDAYRLSEA
jgi:hypothetical protein